MVHFTDKDGQVSACYCKVMKLLLSAFSNSELTKEQMMFFVILTLISRSRQDLESEVCMKNGVVCPVSVVSVSRFSPNLYADDGGGGEGGMPGGGGDFVFSRTIPVVIFYDSFFMIS